MDDTNVLREERKELLRGTVFKSGLKFVLNVHVIMRKTS